MKSLTESDIEILGTQISNVNLDLACEYIENWISQRVKVYVCISNVATLIDCQKDEEYRNVINSADMVTPDGMPLVWIGKKRGSHQIRRTYGPDLMNMLCDKGQNKGISHYLYGGTEAILSQLKLNLKQRYPGIHIAGNHAPPFRDIKELESEEIIEKINQADPDILWIGLGSPKQDFWMQQHRHRLNVPVMVGVGAAFDFMAGVKKQAPLWMQKSGLEWLFRLCTEPKRLWKRYIIGNFLFIYYLLAAKLKGK